MNLNEMIINCEYLVCKKCITEKKRINNGIYPNGKDTRYVDETGKQWNGEMCPDCHNDRMKKENKIRRLKRKARRDAATNRRKGDSDIVGVCEDRSEGIESND